MVIAIIGAGISGLAAGRELAKAGHEVTILEKSRGFGGRMATRYAGKKLDTKLDHGASYFKASSPEFQKFVAELLDKELVQLWGDNFAYYDGEKFYPQNPNPSNVTCYTAVEGMNTIGKYLSRWVDVKTEVKAGGLTHIGSNRRKKRSWIINMSSSDTFEADAVIIATPAPQAYGIIQTTIDEVKTLKIVREIDEVNYKPAYSLMAGFGDRNQPNWEGIVCRSEIIDFISNESAKRTEKQEYSLVVHATNHFSRTHRHSSDDYIEKEMLNELSKIIGGWAVNPVWSQVHFWKFSRALSVLDRPFLEHEYDEAPIALIGDYFMGNTIDAAYCSGVRLANHWIDKYSHALQR